MSRIEKLINELCPDGVEYKSVGDLCYISRGQIISKDYIKNNYGKFPVYSSQTENNGELGKISTYMFDGEYVTWTTDGANAGTVFYRNGKFNVTNVCGLLKIKVENINIKFVYYILQIKAISYVNKGMGNPKLMSNVMAKIKIPIPPIEVQREIVRILDKYSEKNEQLIKELYKEIGLRKKQYNYYRDYLLNFGDDVEWKSLGEIATEFYRGLSIKRDELTENGTPCIRYGEIYTAYGIHFDKCISHTDENNIKSKKYMEYGDILFAVTGESVEDIAKSTAYLGNEKCLVGGDILVMKHEQNPKYLSYALSTTNAGIQKSKGKIKSKVVHANLESIKQIKIPVPPIEEQERIVKILDRFDTLCNDLTNGLFAEIKARKKQYEYYRDKLLTFKEADL